MTDQKTVETCTKTEYAKRKGVTAPAISNAIRRGRVLVLDNGLIDVKASDILWNSKTDAHQSARANAKKRREAATLYNELVIQAKHVQSPRLSETILSFEESRAKREFHAARMAEMEERKAAGELCEVSEVNLVLSAAVVNFRHALERMADKLAERLAPESDAHTCYTIINDEVSLILSQVAQEFEDAALKFGECHA